MKDSTFLNHPPVVPVPADNRPLVAPIYQTVKFEFGSIDETLRLLHGERAGFFYQRAGNPTTRALELTLARLQRREEALVCASGVGVIAQTLLALTRAGDHVLCFLESYGPSRQLIRRTLARFGVTHSLLSIRDLPGIERVLAGQPTRLVLFESPTNPVCRVADIAAITRLARAHGALSVLDNTLAGPHQHGQFPVDLYLHSLTKFIAGHGDVMGGAVIGAAALIDRLRAEFMNLGGVLDPHAAFLIQRGLKTLILRYQVQSASALRLAQYLAAHPAVARVDYPGLPSASDHALARAQMSEFGAVMSLELRGAPAAGGRFAEALRLFALTPSLGSTESLVMPPELLGARDLDAAQQLQSGLTPGTVRLSVGLEDIEDLLADVTQALTQAAG